MDIARTAPPYQDAESLRVVQIVNILATRDGGPARNSLELNLALNRGNAVSNLVWMRGSIRNSVLSPHIETKASEPAPMPRRLRLIGRRADVYSISPFQLFALLKDADIALLHGYFLPWLPPIALLCSILGTTYLITPHGSLTFKQQLVARRRKLVFESLFGSWLGATPVRS